MADFPNILQALCTKLGFSAEAAAEVIELARTGNVPAQITVRAACLMA